MDGSNEADFTYADPRVLQCLAGGDPFARVHRQHLIDQILGFRRDGVPFRARILQTRGNKRGVSHTLNVCETLR